MANVMLDQENAALSVTTLTAAPPKPQTFGGEAVLSVESHAIFAFENGPLAAQDIDGVHARGLNAGCGLAGEGGDNGPGVVGVSGMVIPNDRDFPHDINQAAFLGRGRLAGVLGLANRDQGVAGESATGPGVFGRSQKGPGVVGRAGPGVGVDGQSNSGYGVSGISQNSAGVYGKGSGRHAVRGGLRLGLIISPAGLFDGEVIVNGPLTITGGKNAAVPHPDGTHRLLYSIESPESWFEDFGEAKLVKGKASVRLAPDFAAVVRTTNYHVFLTPYGNCNGLYVARRTATGFEVHEQNGGKSKLPFSYRIVAKRKDLTLKRLQKIKLPKTQASKAEPKTPVPTIPSARGRSKRQGRNK